MACRKRPREITAYYGNLMETDGSFQLERCFDDTQAVPCANNSIPIPTSPENRDQSICSIASLNSRTSQSAPSSFSKLGGKSQHCSEFCLCSLNRGIDTHLLRRNSTSFPLIPIRENEFRDNLLQSRTRVCGISNPAHFRLG